MVSGRAKNDGVSAVENKLFSNMTHKVVCNIGKVQQKADRVNKQCRPNDVCGLWRTKEVSS